MNVAEPSFLALATKPDLDQETAFTICRMISSVGCNFVEEWDWDWLKRANGDYRSLINPAWLDDAWKLLAEKDWYSQQTTNDVDQRISTILPLRDMTKLRTLVLQNNLIQDLRPLSDMKELRDLNFYQNNVSDISVLGNLKALETVSLAQNPIHSFTVLEQLPRLSKLGASADQVPRLRQCKKLPALANLDFGFDGKLEDFEGLPEMPALQDLMACSVNLDGVERFHSLRSLSVYEGNFAAVSRLEGLKNLTHLSISTSEPLDLSPLQGLQALRRLYVGAPKVQGVAVLAGLPSLHSFELQDDENCEAKDLALVRGKLTSWDQEFRSESKRFAPSLEVEVVEQEVFDHYDSKAAYGMGRDEVTGEMLGSEHGWLVEKMADFLSPNFDDNVDFMLPHTSGGRTERLILYSMDAYESLPEIVLGLQEILCRAKNDWIIWFQSSIGELDGDPRAEAVEDFIVWIYPNKIVATAENAAIVRQLINRPVGKFDAKKMTRNFFKKARRLFRSK